MKNEKDFSVLNVLQSLENWYKYLIKNIKNILTITISILLITIIYNYLKSPIHYARTSFVLDSESSSNSIGDIASLASLAGINASSIIDGSSLFQIDNIQELYRSSTMLKETLLSSSSFDNKDELLINRFGLKEKIHKKWKKLGIDFSNADLMQINARLHDSVLYEAIEIIKKKYLIVGKPSRKTTILEIGFDHKDELLAKSFNENLVIIVNKFYNRTRTQKTGKNLKILRKQADSVKNILDNSILNLAKKNQIIPNPNRLSKVSLVPYQQALVDVQANQVIYEEVLKQLEIAKIAHRNKTPLIQIIDKPILPLENSKLKLFECLIYGIFGGLFLSILFYSLKRFYKSLIN